MGTIDIELKKRCVEASNGGMLAREVYDKVFYPEHPAMSFECFRHKILIWKRKQMCDTDTLKSGTYNGFTANKATVQVDKDGNVVQAWVKQTRDEDEQYARLIETIKESTAPITAPVEEYDGYAAECMLEVGLYDMHFGLPNDYSVVLCELTSIIGRYHREEVNIILGQDLFHNDDFRGRTSKGTPNDLRGQFTIAFPAEFATANVREIHCGHLHHEREADIYGVMVRRLSTGNVTDEWSDDSGFIGSHKRFMVFEWQPNRLTAIYYLGGEKRG